MESDVVSSILGIVDHDGGSVGVADLLRGYGAFNRLGHLVLQSSADGLAMLAHVTESARGAGAPAHITVDIPVVLNGVLHRRDELLAKLNPDRREDHCLSDLELVRRLYRQVGTDVFSLLHGSYTLALYDGQDRTLYVSSDLTGSRATAYHAGRTRTYLASSPRAVRAMAGIAARPNDEALAELFMGCRTGALGRGEGLFASVGVMGRGELLTFRRDTLIRKQAREFDLSPHGPRPYPDLCAEFRSLFRQAVSRCLHPSRVNSITVSGGLDSSSIYCVAKALQSEGTPCGDIVGLNFTAEDGGWADERMYTQAIGDRYGPGIERVPLLPGGFNDSLPEFLRASEVPIAGPAGNLWRRQYRAAADHRAATFLTGFWGDEAFAPFNHWFHLLWSLRIPTLLRRAREHHRWIVETPVSAKDTLGMVVKATVQEFMPTLVRRTFQRLRGKSVSTHPLAHGRLSRWLQSNVVPPLEWRSKTRFPCWQRDLLDLPRTRYLLQATSAEVAAHGLTVGHPFMDADLVQFMLRCNGDQLNPGGRYKGLLRDSLRDDVPVQILDRRSKGDFTVAFGVEMNRDLNRWVALGDGVRRLIQSGYLNEQGATMLSDSVGRLTESRDAAHIDWHALDCASLANWLQEFVDSGSQS